MGFILPEIYQSISSDFDREVPKIFIETGTYMGGVPHRMLETYGTLQPFDKIYTIELGEDICKVASKRYKSYIENDGDLNKFNFHTNEKDDSFLNEEEYQFGDTNLKLICGDSPKVLEDILKDINEPVCFWLDAHAGAMKYARGNEDVPLLEELDVISRHKIKEHIIAIDDAHLFGQKQVSSDGGECDYTQITYDKVSETILNINSKYDVGVYKPYDMEMILAI